MRGSVWGKEYVIVANRFNKLSTAVSKAEVKKLKENITLPNSVALNWERWKNDGRKKREYNHLVLFEGLLCFQ